MSETYTQCKLEKQVSEGVLSSRTSFIPTQFAKMNRIVKLRFEDSDAWDEGWRVVAIYQTLPEHMVPDYRKSIRGHRKNTGDSLHRVSNETNCFVP